jgi:hypothetical protein
MGQLEAYGEFFIRSKEDKGQWLIADVQFYIFQ